MTIARTLNENIASFLFYNSYIPKYTATALAVLQMG